MPLQLPTWTVRYLHFDFENGEKVKKIKIPFAPSQGELVNFSGICYKATFVSYFPEENRMDVELSGQNDDVIDKNGFLVSSC